VAQTRRGQGRRDDVGMTRRRQGRQEEEEEVGVGVGKNRNEGVSCVTNGNGRQITLNSMRRCETGVFGAALEVLQEKYGSDP
jgi:hypothetical protein